MTYRVPDHQFDRINSDTKLFILGDYIRDTTAAVGELRVKVHPLSRGRLGHDVDVNLQEETTRKSFFFKHDTPLSDLATTQMVTSLRNFMILFLVRRSWTCHYLLSSKGDHVQRAVHEASSHHLGAVLREHGVIHTVVGRHILTHRGRPNRKSE